MSGFSGSLVGQAISADSMGSLASCLIGHSVTPDAVRRFAGPFVGKAHVTDPMSGLTSPFGSQSIGHDPIVHGGTDITGPGAHRRVRQTAAMCEHTSRRPARLPEARGLRDF